MQIARLIRSRWLWLAGALLFLGGLIVAADRVWPLPLKEVNPARVVVDEQGVPLWRFADSEGIWRYPVTIEEVSPRYLEALIQYEDRWFWDHPGVNPLSVMRATCMVSVLPPETTLPEVRSCQAARMSESGLTPG